MGEEWKTIRRFTNPTRVTLPTLAEIGGDFTDRTTTTIRIPGTTTPVPSKNLSSQMTADGRAIMAVYGAMIKKAALYTNTPDRQQRDLPDSQSVQLAAGSLQAGLHADRQPAHLLPLDPRQLRPGGSVRHLQFVGAAQHSDRAQPSRLRPAVRLHLDREPEHDQRVQDQHFLERPAHSAGRQRLGPRAPTDSSFPRVFGGNGLYSTGIPDVSINGFTGYNGPARVYLLSPTTDISVSDNLTYLHKAHTFNFGFIAVRNRKDQNGRTTYDGSVAFNTSPNTNTTNYALADAVLGNFSTYSEAGSDPMGFFRFTQYEGYADDSWKFSRRLTLSLGLRYSHFIPTYTTANNMVNFDPSLYNPSKAVSDHPVGADRAELRQSL